jgi:hypothetical protein
MAEQFFRHRPQGDHLPWRPSPAHQAELDRHWAEMRRVEALSRAPARQPAASGRWMRGAEKKAKRAVLQNKIRNAERKLNHVTDELRHGMLQFGGGIDEAQRMATDFAGSLVPPRSYTPPQQGPIFEPEARGAANRPVADPYSPSPNNPQYSPRQSRPSRPVPNALTSPREFWRSRGRAMPLPQSHTSPRTPYDPQPAPYIPPGGGYSIPVPWQR